MKKLSSSHFTFIKKYTLFCCPIAGKNKFSFLSWDFYQFDDYFRTKDTHENLDLVKKNLCLFTPHFYSKLNTLLCCPISGENKVLYSTWDFLVPIWRVESLFFFFFSKLRFESPNDGEKNSKTILLWYNGGEIKMYLFVM